MPGQVVGEVSAIHRVDDLGDPFTMTYSSDSGAMSNTHGEAFYPKARNRMGALPPGPAAGRSTNGKIGVTEASRDQRKITADILPTHILENLPQGLKPDSTRNGARFKAEEDWNYYRMPTSATFILKQVLPEDERRKWSWGTGERSHRLTAS